MRSLKACMLAACDVEVGVFLSGDASVQIKVGRGTNTKRTRRRLVQLFITKAHPLPLIPRPFLNHSVISRAILHLTQVDAISPGILPWCIARVAEGMDEQTPEALAGRARRDVGPPRGWFKVGFAIRRQ